MGATRSFTVIAVALLLIAGSAAPFQLPGNAPAIAHAAAATPNVAVALCDSGR
jgi:hypothetical protein